MEDLRLQVVNLTAAVELMNNTLTNQQTQITELAQAVRALQHPQPVVPAPSVQPIVEPHMPLPERFTGNRSDFRNFRNRCLAYFEARPISSGTETQRILLVKTLLQGDSQAWAFELPPDHTALQSVSNFFEAMAVIYDDPDITATAIRKLRNLRQGRNTAEVYSAEFRRWASNSRWENQALIDQFLMGLTDRVSELMLAHPEPRSLEDAMRLAIRVDRRVRFHHESRKQGTELCQSSNARSNTPSEEPMQIGKTKVSLEEKQRRRQEGLCLYCGDQSHRLVDCPKKSGNASV